MEQNLENEHLRVRSNAPIRVDTLIITVMAMLPFLPYVLSALILIAVSMAILIMKQTRASVRAHMRMYSIALAITAVSVLSSLISGNYIGILIAYGVFLILTFATYARTVMTAELFERVIFVSCFGSFLQFFAVIAIKIFKIGTELDIKRPAGFSFSPNYLGSICVLAALLALIALLENKSIEQLKKEWKKNLLCAASVALNCASLLICESRSSLLGIMSGAFILFLLKKRYIICALGALGGIGIWVLGYFAPELFGWYNSLASVFTQRIAIWACAIDGFLMSPLTFFIGMGPMSYKHAWKNGLMDTKWTDLNWLSEQKHLGIPEDRLLKYSIDIQNADHAHNIIADTLINVGLIGAVLYLALMRSFIREGAKKLKNGDKTAFITVIVAIAVIFVQGIPDVTIMWHQTATLFVLMCAASFKKENC